MKTYITQTEALNRYPVTKTELADLLVANKLDVVELLTSDGNQIAIYDDSLAAYVAERDITPEKFKHLRGNLLGIAESARKYKLGNATVSGWVKVGHLKIKDTDKNKKLVDEADVAYLVALGRAKKMRKGKKVFS